MNTNIVQEGTYRIGKALDYSEKNKLLSLSALFFHERTIQMHSRVYSGLIIYNIKPLQLGH